MLEDLLDNRLTWAFLVGTVGSTAYLSVIFFGLIGSFQNRSYMMQYFVRSRSFYTFLGVAVYCMLGGAIALIFQVPETVFVPVQSFILGATWPSIVAQMLSGQQAGPEDEELRRWLTERARSLGVANTSDATQSATEAQQAAARMLEQYNAQLRRQGANGDADSDGNPST